MCEIFSSKFYNLLELYARDVNSNRHPQGTPASDWLKEDRGITLFLPMQSALLKVDKLDDDLRLLQKVRERFLI